MNSLLSLLPIWTLASCSSAHPLKAWYHPSWSNGLIAHYSGGVDLMSGISYLLDLVDLPWGGVINPGLTLNMSRPVSLRNVWSRQGPVRYTHTHTCTRARTCKQPPTIAFKLRWTFRKQMLDKYQGHLLKHRRNAWRWQPATCIPSHRQQNRKPGPLQSSIVNQQLSTMSGCFMLVPSTNPR